MAQIRRADLPEGPHRDLALQLYELHLNAGLPSVRGIARDIKLLSPDTVHRVLVCARVPGWEPLERVVSALHGDVTTFRRLWVAAQRHAGSAGG